ncbi:MULTISPECIES: palindromic element RPE1 domain-containing protein [unclassified Candidatus Tisiphia]|uniref:palindromic element RPE1 domain-containing protein n=1 Tax=unclassified Candidatus Tisiphia TaxID=2996318 RepID=UPI00313C6320
MDKIIVQILNLNLTLNQNSNLNNISLLKLAYAEEFKEATSLRTAADDDVREEQSTGSTNKLPAEVEFRKRYNNN